MSENTFGDRPRYSAGQLPPYSYVPGHNYHPISHPLGHMHGHVAQPVPPLSPDAWQASEEYRYGIDLFNHGFYWEAHEAWEALWHAAGRSGAVAVWLKALIKLAAAAVKLREGNSRGAAHHARRSQQLLDELKRQFEAPAEPEAVAQYTAGQAPRPPKMEARQGALQYCGVLVNDLDAIAAAIASEAGQGGLSPQPQRLLPQWIGLRDAR
jgi:uncharacterized protein